MRHDDLMRLIDQHRNEKKAFAKRLRKRIKEDKAVLDRLAKR